jgi:hypothetical protein
LRENSVRIYYRISDNSYPKPKLIGATKEVCLMNFIKAFHEVIFGGTEAPPEDFTPPIRIIADRCERTTIKTLMESGLPVTISDHGNAGSLIQAVQMAVETGPEDELVYFCEDDYLHLGSAPRLLEEGIKRADYVSLYDHPDKYTRLYNGGEYSKVIKTASSHWRYTASTCMTFGAKVKTLKEDLEVWKKYTDGTHPHDHHIFTELGKNGRKLAIPIPGVACHTDLWFSGQMSQILIEPWAIELMIRELENIIMSADPMRKDLLDLKLDMAWAEGKRGSWERLVALDAIIKARDVKPRDK